MSSTLDDAELARRLRDVLKQKGISQRDISAGLDMPYRTVQNYLSGEIRIPATFVFRLCHLIDVEPDYLLYQDFKPNYADLGGAILEAMEECGSIPGFLAGPDDSLKQVSGEAFISLGWRMAVATAQAYDAARKQRLALKKRLSTLPIGKRDHSSEI